ncbi:MAG: serine/threonine protein kinase, partial [Jatrophihabitans sp.]
MRAGRTGLPVAALVPAVLRRRGAGERTDDEPLRVRGRHRARGAGLGAGGRRQPGPPRRGCPHCRPDGGSGAIVGAVALREIAVSPELFPGFHDVAVLGVGRRSTVYRAVEDGTGRPVALKVVGTEGATPAALEAFARESAVLAALGSHPHIVTLYRTLAVAPRPILVLELCRGSFAARLRRGRMPVPEAVAAVVRIAGALATAHSAGVLHRNVCPATILVTEFGEPALADFAIARLHDAGLPAAELLDYPGPHAAPEVLLGQQVDERTDVYGLAATLYELLAGRPAFGEMAGEPVAATILRILRDPARPLAGVPVELSDVVVWGMAKEPCDRPPTVVWFADELRRIQTRQRWVRTDMLVRTARVPVSSSRPAPLTRMPPQRPTPPAPPPVVAPPSLPRAPVRARPAR